jgi:hypothetical protein
LVRNRVAALWAAYIDHGPGPVEGALSGEGGHYFELIRSRFWGELRSVEELPIPAGWSFRPPGVGTDEPPSPPNLMQKRTAFEVLTQKRVGNWSSVGTGKTLAAIVASRVANRRHTLIVCNKATMAGWRREVLNAYPDSVVHGLGTLPTRPPQGATTTPSSITSASNSRVAAHSFGRLPTPGLTSWSSMRFNS